MDKEPNAFIKTGNLYWLDLYQLSMKNLVQRS